MNSLHDTLANLLSVATLRRLWHIWRMDRSWYSRWLSLKMVILLAQFDAVHVRILYNQIHYMHVVRGGK